MTREEAIEIVGKNMPTDKSLPIYEALQTLFPELRESENERIREKIVDIVKVAPFDEEKDILLDWLEKQKEQMRPEVNFKIEERKWVHDAVDNIFPEDGDFMSEVDFRKIIKSTARHFYELGINAKMAME